MTRGWLAPLVACVFALHGVACAEIFPNVPATAKARALVRQRRETDAVVLLRKELTRADLGRIEEVETRKLLVRVLASMGDLNGARSEAEQLQKRLPSDDPTAMLELGHALELTHRFDEALAAYDEASERAPRSPLGPREAGMRAARWGETHDAAPRLEEAYRRGARDADFLHVLGLVRVHEGDLAGAEAAYLEGARVEADGVENLTGLATVGLLRKDPEKTLAAYDAILQKRPRHGPALLGRAYALCLLGRTNEAAHALDVAEEAGASPTHVKRLRQLVEEGRHAKPAPTL